MAWLSHWLYDATDQQGALSEIGALAHFDFPLVLKPKGLLLPGPNVHYYRLLTEYFPESLEDILSAPKNVEWWIPMTKMITITGIVMCMQRFHRSNYFDGHLQPKCIGFDSNHYVRVFRLRSSRDIGAAASMSMRETDDIYVAPELSRGATGSEADVTTVNSKLEHLMIWYGGALPLKAKRITFIIGRFQEYSVTEINLLKRFRCFSDLGYGYCFRSDINHIYTSAN
jgi:hypothetical protein